MGEFNKGVLGAFSGKVGSVVGSNWRDIDYMRGLPKKSSKPATAKQLLVRDKFRLLIQFLTLVKAVIDQGFKNEDTRRATAFNLAFTANKDAFAGTDTEPELDFSKMIFSKGSGVNKATGCKVVADGEGALTVTWDAISGNAQALTDEATIVLYSEEYNEVVVQVGALRSLNTAQLEIPSNWVSCTIHGYVYMTSKEDKNSLTSYAGALSVL
ncbi:hypothetical protein ADIARSV_2710 [Arcticibacter svalbardensis MN12-7]|uniref:Uncharacterized protein n=1 Tax=Arcticibacter svalbardensis MN12-7 TaxID=1150600 RepID=R9GQJ3_9SPHI|nr:DUF6266 family protein [Arcticibacter svalbardensis]EOR94097.1 hypothetical protein ADIARSV_2710 [Arcticibacter svalbardensis MN12-7]